MALLNTKDWLMAIYGELKKIVEGNAAIFEQIRKLRMLEEARSKHEAEPWKYSAPGFTLNLVCPICGEAHVGDSCSGPAILQREPTAPDYKVTPFEYETTSEAPPSECETTSEAPPHNENYVSPNCEAACEVSEQEACNVRRFCSECRKIHSGACGKTTKNTESVVRNEPNPNRESQQEYFGLEKK